MRSSSSLLGRGLFWIASEMLEILTKILRRIFNENPCAPCAPWIKFPGNRGTLDGTSLNVIFVSQQPFLLTLKVLQKVNLYK